MDLIWKDRPGLSEAKAVLLEERYSGRTTAQKLDEIRAVMRKEGAEALLIDVYKRQDKITTALTMVGLIVIGGVASTTVAAPIKFVFTAGEMTVSIQEILNKIMPTLVPMLVTVGCWLLADKKGWNSNKLILGILGLAAVMVLLGIM